MHTITRKNIFESGMQTLVNPVNCVGVMGAGLALAFKNKYPDMFSTYCMACRENRIRPGKPFYFFEEESNTGILLFPTKDHWRNPSKLEYIEKGLDNFIENYHNWGITSIAFPALGCGYGGLETNIVIPLMVEKLKTTDIPVKICLPSSK